MNRCVRPGKHLVAAAEVLGTMYVLPVVGEEAATGKVDEVVRDWQRNEHGRASSHRHFPNTLRKKIGGCPRREDNRRNRPDAGRGKNGNVPRRVARIPLVVTPRVCLGQLGGRISHSPLVPGNPKLSKNWVMPVGVN